MRTVRHGEITVLSLLIAVTCLIVLLLQGSVALGATAQVTGGTLRFAAAPGEANDVAITRRFELGEQQTIGQLVANPLRHALVVDREGGAIAMWAEFTRAPTHPRGDPSRLLAAYAPPGGSFGTPQLVDVANNLGVPALAVDDAGNAVAIWRRTGGTRVAFRPAGSVFGGHQTLGEDATVAHVAMNASGEAVAVWHSETPGHPAHYAAAFRPAGGSFGPEQPLGFGHFEGTRPRAAINDSGEALVVWHARDTAGDHQLHAQTRPPGGSFGAPQQITNARFIFSQPALAIGPTGEATAAWEQFFRDIYVAERPPGDAFDAPRFIADQTSWGPQIAIDDEGNMLMVFGSFTGGGFGGVFASYRPVGGEFGAPTLVSDRAGSPHADFGGNGRAAIIFFARPPGGEPSSEVQLVIRGRDGRYSPQVTVSVTPGHQPVEALVGAASNGEVVVLWRHNDSSLDDALRADYLIQAVRGREQLVVRDSGARLAAGAGCEAVDSHTVVCTTDVTRMQVLLGNRTDRAVLNAAVPASVNGGQAKDVIDTRNGVVDQVSCGQGKDTVAADADDVVAGDCE
jgi:hypothetical protein